MKGIRSSSEPYALVKARAIREREVSDALIRLESAIAYGARIGDGDCIELDKHEWGLVPQSDENFMASLRLPDGNFLPTTDWCDPRRGPLFYILDALKPPKEAA